ncbi:MAG: hypothetical protein UZ14_CFX002002190 [Chloroflexi bacterium OLB14]|nr:MAG: hypothetical protein UZ14_CFX002002190 [Chloroflexi bacterium OLB14]
MEKKVGNADSIVCRFLKNEGSWEDPKDALNLHSSAISKHGQSIPAVLPEQG